MTRHRLDFGGGIPDIVVETQRDISADLAWLRGYFESAEQDGVTFRAGETLQAGWPVWIFKDAGDGALELHEPTFSSFPIEWRPGVERSLRHMALQRAVCERLDVEPAFPSILQSLAVSDRMQRGAPAFTMDRALGGGTDSGWLIAEAGATHSDAHLESLYALVVSHPAALPFLALPPPALVSIDAREARIDVNGRGVSTSDDETLRKLVFARS